LDYNGNERGAIGFGNQGQTGYIFGGRTFLEVSDASGTGTSPEFALVMSSTFNGSKGYGFYEKMMFRKDGRLEFYKNGQNSGVIGAGVIMTLDPNNGILTLGSGDGTQAELVGLDEYNSIVFHEAGNPVTTYYAYGQTLASAAIGGHKFMVGATYPFGRGTESVEMWIANDGVAIKTPAAIPSTPQFSSAAVLYTDETAGAGNPVLKAKLKSSDGTVLSRTLAGLEERISGTAALDFASTAAQTSSDLTLTVTGASTGDSVCLGVPTAAVLANTSFTAWVSAANTVTVRFNNYSSSSKDPASGTFRVTVFHY